MQCHTFSVRPIVAAADDVYTLYIHACIRIKTPTAQCSSVDVGGGQYNGNKRRKLSFVVVFISILLRCHFCTAIYRWLFFSVVHCYAYRRRTTTSYCRLLAWALLAMLCFIRHSASVAMHFIHEMVSGLLVFVCVKRRLLVCPLRLSFNVNSWMHYFNWTPTMGDSYSFAYSSTNCRSDRCFCAEIDETIRKSFSS